MCITDTYVYVLMIYGLIWNSIVHTRTRVQTWTFSSLFVSLLLFMQMVKHKETGVLLNLLTKETQVQQRNRQQKMTCLQIP